jgi:hypothetical protein
VNIHGDYEHLTCENFLPKKKAKNIGWVAQCVKCGEMYLLRYQHFFYWQPTKKVKGENKATIWTSRPLTEEDEEHYGLEGKNK